MTYSTRTLILTFTALIVIFTAVGIGYFAQREITSSVSRSEFRHAKDLVETVYLNVLNEYQGLVFYENSALARRKGEIRSIVGIACSIVSNEYEKYRSGNKSLSDAQTDALNSLKLFRYNNGRGYVWVNDTSSPVPKVLMHPTIPEIVGRVNKGPRFNVTVDERENLFVAFLKTAMEEPGEGYVKYLWPKPTPEGLTEDREKISYVKLFKNWNWIIGSGVYIDDIQADVSKRRKAMLEELQATFEQIKVGKSGYMYIFSGEKKFLIHPIYEGEPSDDFINHRTGRHLLVEMIEASRDDGELLYLWDKPPDHTGEFKYLKRGYVKYFEPLDWYICAAVYVDALKEAATGLTNKVFLVAATVLALALVLTFIFSGRIIRPLQALTEATRRIGADMPSPITIPCRGSSETRELGTVMNQMLASISQNIREKEKLLQALEQGNMELQQTNEKLENEISEHMEAREELVRLRNNLNSIIESMPSILIGVDENDVITHWNSKAEEDSGISYEEAKGRLLPEVLPFIGKIFDKARKDIAAGRSYELNKNRRQLDDSPRYEDITIYPLDGQGENGAVIRLDDITTRVQIEEIMVQTEKMMSVGGLAAGMAHEINNPLSAILQAAQNIRRRTSPDIPRNTKAAEESGISMSGLMEYMTRRKILKMLDGISASAKRASAIISNMLEFSRKSDAHQTSCKLEKLVEKALKLAEQDYNLKKKYDFRQIEIKREYDTGLPYVICSPTEIEQVLLNLLGNAAQAMQENPSPEKTPIIVLRVKKEGNYIVTEVEDNGPGMDEETRKKVFEPFFTTKPEGVGTGLGLSVSYFIITKNHSGHFSLESTPGHGTKFSFKLPINNPE